MLECAVCTDSCKWIYHFRPYPHITTLPRTDDWAYTLPLPRTRTTYPIIEFLHRCVRNVNGVGPETSFVVLYSSGNVKQLDILKTGKPNIGTTLHTVLFTQCNLVEYLCGPTDAVPVKMKAWVRPKSNFSRASKDKCVTCTHVCTLTSFPNGSGVQHMSPLAAQNEDSLTKIAL